MKSDNVRKGSVQFWVRAIITMLTVAQNHHWSWTIKSCNFMVSWQNITLILISFWISLLTSWPNLILMYCIELALMTSWFLLNSKINKGFKTTFGGGGGRDKLNLYVKIAKRINWICVFWFEHQLHNHKTDRVSVISPH